VVDLDGSVAGTSVNGAAIERIVNSADVPVQLGGGIRTSSDVERLLALGIGRAVIGTSALREPMLVAELVERWGDRNRTRTRRARWKARRERVEGPDRHQRD